jgi:hypothetical protein
LVEVLLLWVLLLFLQQVEQNQQVVVLHLDIQYIHLHHLDLLLFLVGMVLLSTLLLVVVLEDKMDTHLVVQEVKF